MRILKDTYLSRRFFLILMLGIFAFVMAYVFPLLFIWVAGTLLTVLLLLFVELFELYKRVDGIDALRVVADKLSNGEENPVCLVLRNRYPVSTCLRVIDEIPVEFQNRNVLFRLKVNAGEQRRSITRYVLQNEVLIISGRFWYSCPCVLGWSKGVILFVRIRMWLFIPRL